MRLNRKHYYLLLILILGVGFVYSGFVLFPREQQKPNVILITIDALRPDHLSCYGYKRNTSPYIDRFAKEGVLFTHAVSQIPETQSSVASFLTSTYPSRHYRDYGGDWSYLNPHTPSLAKILKKFGYVSVLFTDFEEPNQLFRIYGLRDDFNASFQTKPNDPGGLTQQVLAWLKKNKNKKFFLYCHYFGPHAPYRPSLPYSETFFKDSNNGIDSQVPIAKNDQFDLFGFIPQSVAENGITSANYYRCQYDGKIRLVDEQIGHLLEGVKQLDLDKNTLVVLIADHGESLGEHHLYFLHVYSLFDELIRVPFIIRYPGVIPKNKIIPDQIQLIDVAPTILNFLGIKIEKNHPMEGMNLKLFILGSQNYPQDRYAFGFNLDGMTYFVRTEKWKLIYMLLPLCPDFMNAAAPLYVLESLKTDPFETNNLVNEEKDIFNDLNVSLVRFMKKKEVEARDAEKEAEAFLKTHKIEFLDEQAKEKLKSLGYVQ